MSVYRQKSFRESCVLTSRSPGGELAAVNTGGCGVSEAGARCQSRSQTNPTTAGWQVTRMWQIGHKAGLAGG